MSSNPIQPPDGDALDGTCRGSVEPLASGGSPRSSYQPFEDLRQPWKPEDLRQGDLVFAWNIIDAAYIPYHFEAHLCSKVAPLCWVINLSSGKRVRKKLRDLWIPRS